jgi:hypothetical protein
MKDGTGIAPVEENGPARVAVPVTGPHLGKRAPCAQIDQIDLIDLIGRVGRGGGPVREPLHAIVWRT